jgi:teichuronic acid biosynthesis glycosyltransferase TuaG
MKDLIFPVVSIVVPVYNAESYLRDAVNSVIKQSFVSWELILVDDRSSDSSKNIIKELALMDERIKFFCMRNNKGAANARNKGISMANGSFLAFLDADDIWTENKLKVQLDFMVNNKVTFSFGGYEFVDENNISTGKVVHVPQQIQRTGLLKDNIISTPSVMIDLRKIPKDVVRMPNLDYGEDLSLWLKIIDISDTAYGINEVLFRYRRISTSLSANKVKILYKKLMLYMRFKDMGVSEKLYYYIFSVFNAIRKRI